MPKFLHPLADKPLTSDESDRLERALRRLKSEFRSLCLQIPEGQRGASGMARYLEVERTGCQRLLEALHEDANSLMMIQKFPGQKALTKMVSSFRTKGVDGNDLAAVESAVRELFTVIKALGGSRNTVRSRVENGILAETEQESVRPMSQSSTRRAQEDHFVASRDVVGRWSELNLGMWFMQPSETDREGVDVVSVFGYSGQRMRERALPLAFACGNTESQPDNEGQEKPKHNRIVESEIGSILLSQFCSKPQVQLSRRATRDGVRYFVDQPKNETGASFDLVGSHHLTGPMPHPAEQSPPVQDFWQLSQNPSKHLLFDGYLHKSLAHRSVMSLSAHAWKVDLPSDDVDWFTEINPRPKLQSLGRGTSHTDCHAYPYATEVADHVFDEAGWNSDDFIGFRCEVSYPIWRVGYRMRVDFGSE